jgi:hypothetical protein
MKWLLLSVCGGFLLFTTGCLYSQEEWRGHANNARFGGVATGPSAVEVWTTGGATRPPRNLAQ